MIRFLCPRVSIINSEMTFYRDEWKKKAKVVPRLTAHGPPDDLISRRGRSSLVSAKYN